MLWMVGAPLVGLVKSVASGAGSIASGVAKGIGKAVSGADKEQTAIAAASGAPAGGNGENAVIGEESSVSEMFGGLDLTKVKSALEDEGPMGPPEEGPKTVYKVMIGVLQGMAQTLLRMEATMKMLLAIEYERVKGIVAQSAQESIAQSKIPDGDEGDGKRGILGRGKDMLGGAWNKAKDSPTWLKMLGLVGLLGAIKFWKDDLEKAVAKILEWFTKAYEYFTADDFTWDKFKDDVTTKFLPKIRDFIFGVLDWIWGAIKGVATEWLFGEQGDKAIRTQSGQAGTAQANISKFGLSKTGLEANPYQVDKTGLSEEKQESLVEEHKGLVQNMLKISRESDWRIQWTGMGLFGKQHLPGSGRTIALSIPFGAALNAQPIVDGRIMKIEDLEDIQMQKLGGITKGMSDDKKASIKSALAEKTALLHEKIALEGAEYKPGEFMDASTWAYLKGIVQEGTGEDVFKRDIATRLKEIEEERLVNLEDIKYSGQDFGPPSETLSLDTTPINQALKDAAKQMDQPGRNPGSVVIDNSVNAPTNTTNQTITALKPQNDNLIAMALNERDGARNVFGYG